MTPSLAKNLQVNNARKSKFDVFWDIYSKVLEELTVVKMMIITALVQIRQVMKL